MKTCNWDAIVASQPMNRLAALAAAVGYSSDEETMLAKAKKDIQAVAEKTPNFVNLMGLKKGRLEVVAYGGRIGKKCAWIVRCKCGRYEIRRTRALRSDNPNDRCRPCNDLDRLRNGFAIREAAE